MSSTEDAEDFAKSELAAEEMHKYEESGSEDDYTTWKLKQYVDDRFNQIIVILVAVIVTLIYFLKK